MERNLIVLIFFIVCLGVVICQIDLETSDKTCGEGMDQHCCVTKATRRKHRVIRDKAGHPMSSKYIAKELDHDTCQCRCSVPIDKVPGEGLYKCPSGFGATTTTVSSAAEGEGGGPGGAGGSQSQSSQISINFLLIPLTTTIFKVCV